MARSDITLWGAGTTRVLRVHWALLELGLDYQVIPIQARTGETQEPAYSRLNPKQKIPFLQDGDVGISESPAIAHYLFHQYGAEQDVYVPDSAAAQARSDEWCYFVMTEFDAHPLYIIRRHRYLSHIYGEAPEAVRSAEEYFHKQMLAYAPRAAAADPYLFGDQISVADILLSSCIAWAVNYDQPVDQSYLDYFARTSARPAFIEAQQRNHVPAAT